MKKIFLKNVFKYKKYLLIYKIFVDFKNISVLRGGGGPDDRRVAGSAVAAGGGEGEARGRAADPARGGRHHTHHEAHLGPAHQVILTSYWSTQSQY